MNTKALPTKEDLNNTIETYTQVLDEQVLSRDPLSISEAQYNTLDKLPELFSTYKKNIEILYTYLDQRTISPQFEKLIIYSFEIDDFQKSVSYYISNRNAIGSFNHIEGWLNNSISRVSNMIKLSPLDGENNAVIIGSNGAGKSSFAEYFRRAFPNNVIALPAQKLLHFRLNDSLMGTKIEKIQQLQKASKLKEILFDDNVYNRNERDLQQEFSQIIAAFVDKSLTDSINTIVDDSNIFYTFLNIFNSLYPDITFYDFIKTEDKDISTRELKPMESSKLYDINSMSDGEKVTIYYIIHILLAPEKTTIIIDEPETYLNASIYSRLWDMLEDKRSDCRFIYISHRIDFIESRTESDLIWFKSFKAPNDWEFQFIETGTSETFPKELIIQLSGIKKNVLFCEGNDKTSLDYAIYQSLFPNITVIPVGSSDKVIQYTKSYNAENSIFHNKAFGIIDNDLRTDEEINRLEAESIFSTKYLEIEMLLCDEEVIKTVLTANYYEMSKLEAFKELFIKKMDERKTEVATRRLKKIYENMLNRTTYDTKIDIIENINTLHKDLLSVDKSEDFLKKISNLIAKKDYQGLIELCTLEHKEITWAIANPTLDNHYEEKAKNHLLKNTELQEAIKKKYFEGLQTAFTNAE